MKNKVRSLVLVTAAAVLLPLITTSCGNTVDDMELPLPEIEATASPEVLAPGGESDITVEVILDRSQPLRFTYAMEMLDGGRLELSSGGLGTGAGVRLSRSSALRYETAVWTAPDSAGEYRLAFSVSEQLTSGHTARDTLYITVTE